MSSLKYLHQAFLMLGGYDPPDADVTCRLLCEIGGAGIHHLVELIRFHRVIPQAHHNLTALRLPTGARDALKRKAELLAELDPYMQQVTSTGALYESFVRNLADWTGGVPVVGLKGIVLRDYYQHSARQLNDIDILIDRDRLWPLLDALYSRGFSAEKVRFGRYPSSPVGAVGICPTNGDYAGGKVYLDIHFGAFPSLGEGLIRVNTGENYGNVSPGFLRPTPEALVLVLVAHVMRQGFCRLRDLNDIGLILAQAGIDQGHLYQALARSHLLEIFEVLVRLLRWVYPSRPVPQWPSGIDRPPSAWERTLLLGRRTRNRRFTDGVTFTASRVWQIRYIWRLYGANGGWMSTALRTMKAAAFLLASGRPYRVWKVPTQPLAIAQHFVLSPLASSLAPFDEQRLREYARTVGARLVWDQECQFAVLNPGGPNEFVLAGNLVLSQCGYDGTLTPDPVRQAALQRLLEALGQEWSIAE
jgi:hypothetical protein